MFRDLLYILELLLFSGLSLIVIYNLILMLAGWINYKSILSKCSSTSESLNRIAVLVPAYKEDEVIVDVAQRLTKIKYPSHCFDVFVIADSLLESTICDLKELVNVIIVEFEESTKSKSINYALNTINKQYDIVVINDADNIPDDNFLQVVNAAYNRGSRAMQSQRVAKNTNTKMAILDGASEAINNHIYRKGLNGLGLSSAVIGSGMAFDYPLFRELMSSNRAVGGFDKILQLALLERGVKIHYIVEGIIYDEKVEDVTSFRNQRKRWISSQIKYFATNFFKAWRLLFKGNFDFFNLAVVCGAMPPRPLILALFLLSIAFVALSPKISFLGLGPWLLLATSYLLTLFLCIPRMIVHRSFLGALLQVPGACLNLLLAFFGVKNANQSFIHTKHSNSGVDNIFREKKS